MDSSRSPSLVILIFKLSLVMVKELYRLWVPDLHYPELTSIKGRVRSFEHSLPYVMTRTNLDFLRTVLCFSNESGNSNGSYASS